MSTTPLDTNFKDDILASSNAKRKYQMTYNDDGTVSFQDVTAYSQMGSAFGAKEVNEERAAINKINSDRIVTLDEIDLVTEPGFFVDAMAVKQLNRKLNKVYRTKPVSGVEVVRVGNTVTLYVNRVVEGVQGNFVYSGHFGTVPPGYRPATENSLLLVGDRIVGSTVVGKFYASIFPDGKIEWSSENSHSGPNSYVFYATYVTSDQLPVE